ncbi:hypothetical protein M433DRAFT_140310 [Acidomyces richmondensis BFW]|nr:MAG: hypothetical protein FE78DRAFT_94255 [Acidomyces sp. 'richmondensis']KYG49208.1 hypothetical protein M433DRAFT_140310 [Acidomyces richmondensis BFW]
MRAALMIFGGVACVSFRMSCHPATNTLASHHLRHPTFSILCKPLLQKRCLIDVATNEYCAPLAPVISENVSTLHITKSLFSLNPLPHPFPIHCISIT